MVIEYVPCKALYCADTFAPSLKFLGYPAKSNKQINQKERKGEIISKKKTKTTSIPYMLIVCLCQ